MSDDYTGHVVEQVLDDMKAVHELVAKVPKMAHQLDRVEQDVAELKQHKSLPAHAANGHA